MAATKCLYPVVYILSEMPHLYDCLVSSASKKIQFKNISLSATVAGKLEDNQIDALKDVECLLTDCHVLAKVYRNMPNLKWAHSTWAGVAELTSEVRISEVPPNFILTRHGGVAFASLMAEYMLCQILSWEWKTRLIWDCQKVKHWLKGDLNGVRCLNEITVCILGVGNMGREIAKALKERGATILGFCRTPKSTESLWSDFDEISTKLDTLLPKCDYLCSVLPSTHETCGLLNDILDKCSKKPVFINAGRGSVITEDHLIIALRNEWISGAVLDVFENEPLSQSSNLWSMPNVVITPHIAALSRPKDVAAVFLKNLQKYVNGETMENTVNWSSGY